MNLPSAANVYDVSDQQRVRAALTQADGENFKRGQDVELLQGEKLVLKSPNGSSWQISIDDAGTITGTPL